MRGPRSANGIAALRCRRAANVRVLPTCVGVLCRARHGRIAKNGTTHDGDGLLTGGLLEKARRLFWGHQLSRLVGLADTARDLRDYDKAAELYRRAAKALPSRIDLSVQHANMLKDAGRFDAAETVYLNALARTPHPAEIHLQLGHLHKLAGHRAPALDHYQMALALDPALQAALNELAEAGVVEYQVIATESRWRESAALDLAAGAAVELYGRLRMHFDVPPVQGGETTSFAVILVLDDACAQSLQDQITAVLAQSHVAWTLTVVCESRPSGSTAQPWPPDPRIRWTNPPAGKNAELRLANEIGADWTLFLDPCASPHPLALTWLAATAARCGCAAIFTDEEIATPSDPALLKPVLRQIADRYSIAEANLCGETIAVSKRALVNLAEDGDGAPDGEGRWPLFRALIGRQPVAHIPLPLFRRSALAPEPPAIRLPTQPPRAQPVAPGIGSDAALAVIIPTKNNSEDVRAFIDSLAALARAPERLEILVVNNGEAAGDDPILLALSHRPGVTVRDLVEPFNWSRFSNLGAAWTRAPVLVFANDDMLMLSNGWDESLLDLIARPDVGAAGAKLIYPDGALQHAGILFGWNGSVIHDGLYRQATSAAAHQRWQVTRTVSAVTGAFLATRRDVFEAMGGFDETNLAISYSDVDYALKVRSRGLDVVWTPHITAVHYESKTRGLDRLDLAKAARNEHERRCLEARWPGLFEVEPSLNPFWLQKTLPFRLLGVPSEARLWAYIESGARLHPWAVEPPAF